jgi:DNA modification methylase
MAKINCIEQTHEENYSLFLGDSLEVLPSIPDASVHLSVYSPPFAKESGGALYTYSSSPRDFSNATSYKDFFDAYEMLVKEITRVTKPGCFTAVHTMAVPATCNLGNYLTDFPGHIIQTHVQCRNKKCKADAWEKSHGICGHGWFDYIAEHVIWKEPLAVRLRTMAKGLNHSTTVENCEFADFAGGDKVLMFRAKGTREANITHPTGFQNYYGATQPPHDLDRFKNWTGDQKENIRSHYIWRRYASCIWDDIRGTLGEYERDSDFSPVLPYEAARDKDDERHVHPLQLDVIARCVDMRTNPGDTVLTPFMGVGSEVYQAVRMGRRGLGIELKPTYYAQAVKNCATATVEKSTEAVLPGFEP